MSLPRLRLENCTHDGEIWRINSKEEHHLVRVRRCYNGSLVEGLLAGEKIKLRLEYINGVLCAHEIVREKEEGYFPKVELLLGLLKNDQLDSALRFSAETGVYAIHLLICERSVPRFTAEKAEEKMSRWRKRLDEATKQAGAASAPILYEPVEFNMFNFDALPAQRLAALLSPMAKPLAQIKIEKHTSIAIGPEGDWSPDESSALMNFNFCPVSLGKRIMRASTAVCAAASGLAMLYNDW